MTIVFNNTRAMLIIVVIMTAFALIKAAEQGTGVLLFSVGMFVGAILPLTPAFKWADRVLVIKTAR